MRGLDIVVRGAEARRARTAAEVENHFVTRVTLFYLDTSVYNHIADDEGDGERVMNYLTSDRAKVLVSAMNVSELAACDDSSRRLHLLSLTKRLAGDDRPLNYPTDLLRLSLEAYSRRVPILTVTVSPERDDVWIALSEPTRMDVRCRAEFFAHNAADEHSYREIHERGRQGLQPVVEKLPEKARRTALRNPSALAKLYFGNVGFLKEMYAGVFQKLNHPEFIGHEQTLLRELEPWKFYSAAMAAGIWNRAVQHSDWGWKSNAGAVDTRQSVYLAFCRIFVTADANQRRLLRPIAKLGHTPRKVISFGQLKALAAAWGAAAPRAACATG